MKLNYNEVCEIIHLYDKYDGDMNKVSDNFNKPINNETILTIINQVNSILKREYKYEHKNYLNDKLNYAIALLFINNELSIAS